MNKLTDWEAGQELIKASDCLVEVRSELFNSHPALADMLIPMINKISREFDALGSHGFGITTIKPWRNEGTLEPKKGGD